MSLASRGRPASPPGPGMARRATKMEAAGVELSQDTPRETGIQHPGGAENGAFPLDAADMALVLRLLSQLTQEQTKALVTLARAMRPGCQSESSRSP